ncbi:hypothetical protein D9M69_449000 [compost metagenome]
MELPPRAKKWLSAVSRSTFRLSRQSPAMHSAGDCAATGAWLAAACPSLCRASVSSAPDSSRKRQAERCSLPLEVFGKVPGASSATTLGASLWAMATAWRMRSISSSSGTCLAALRPISAATPNASRPSCTTGKAATRPLRTSLTCSSTVRSMSWG